MPRYLISFDDGAMDFIPEEEMPAVTEASHAVIREAQDAGVWVFAGWAATAGWSSAPSPGCTPSSAWPSATNAAATSTTASSAWPAA